MLYILHVVRRILLIYLTLSVLVWSVFDVALIRLGLTPLCPQLNGISVLDKIGVRPLFIEADSKFLT